MPQDTIKPSVEFDKETLLEIVEEIAPGIFLSEIDQLEKYFREIQRYQAKTNPKYFYSRMRKNVDLIEQTVDDLVEIAKQYEEDYADEESLTNGLKETILAWLSPVKQQLQVKQQIPGEQRLPAKRQLLLKQQLPSKKAKTQRLVKHDSSPLPDLIFDKERLQDIIKFFKIKTVDLKTITSNVDCIEQLVNKINNYQTKNNPEIFYNAMRAALIEIENLTEDICKLAGFQNIPLSNSAKRILQQMIKPLFDELKRCPVKRQLPVKQLPSKKAKTQLLVQHDTLPLPELIFDKDRLQDIIKFFDTKRADMEAITSNIDSIEQLVNKVNNYKTKKNPEIFYNPMITALIEIKNLTEEIYKFAGPDNIPRGLTLKRILQQMIKPIFDELNMRQEMPSEEREELELKTRHLYAEQSVYSREGELQLQLMEFLQRIKALTTERGIAQPKCTICYAKPSDKNKKGEYWVEAFLSVLYDHLTAAGLNVIMDIRDLKPGDSQYRFVNQMSDGNPILLVGTESLLEKYIAGEDSILEMELSIIANRLEKNGKLFGAIEIYPMLLSGTNNSSFPEIFDSYCQSRDARIGYRENLEQLINFMYQNLLSGKQTAYRKLWYDFYQESPALQLNSEAIEQELRTYEFHRIKLNLLGQGETYRQPDPKISRFNCSLYNLPDEEDHIVSTDIDNSGGRTYFSSSRPFGY